MEKRRRQSRVYPHRTHRQRLGANSARFTLGDAAGAEHPACRNAGKIAEGEINNGTVAAGIYAPGGITFFSRRRPSHARWRPYYPHRMEPPAKSRFGFAMDGTRLRRL